MHTYLSSSFVCTLASPALLFLWLADDPKMLRTVSVLLKLSAPDDAVDPCRSAARSLRTVIVGFSVVVDSKPCSGGRLLGVLMQ